MLTSWSCVNSTIISSTIAELPIIRWTGVVFVSAAQSCHRVTFKRVVHSVLSLQRTDVPDRMNSPALCLENKPTVCMADQGVRECA